VKDNIKVSVICLTYNHEKYLKSCLDGFIKQNTNFLFEVIVHDDASTDKTAEIISEYKRKYPDIFVTILQNENQYSKGVNIVRDIIMPRVRGDYIAFCEGDDAWIVSDKLQQQIDFMEKNLDYSACVHNTVFHHCEKHIKDFPMFIWHKDTDLTFEDIMRWSAFGYQTSSLVTRKILIETMPPFGYNEFPLAVFLILQGKIHFIARNMSLYRFRSGETSTRYNVYLKSKMESEYQSAIEELEHMYEYVDLEKKTIIKCKIDACKGTLNSLLHMTDEQYKEEYNKSEKVANIKYFIRSNFQVIYKLLKRVQISFILKH
jgi:glycosyltransferase involved in cell wall biosynthesis